jgi:hypothetical protein
MIYNIVILRFGGIYVCVCVKVLEHESLKKFITWKIKKIICLLMMKILKLHHIIMWVVFMIF